jgi:hypothetical protein
MNPHTLIAQASKLAKADLLTLKEMARPVEKASATAKDPADTNRLKELEAILKHPSV